MMGCGGSIFFGAERSRYCPQRSAGQYSGNVHTGEPGALHPLCPDPVGSVAGVEHPEIFPAGLRILHGNIRLSWNNDTRTILRK